MSEFDFFPDWQRRGTDDTAGWINELRCLADHPNIVSGWTRQAIRTIAAGLTRTTGISPPMTDIARQSEMIMDQIRDELVRQVLRLPEKGTPVAQLTERDKLALAIAAGAPYVSEVVDGKMTFRTTVPVGVADDGQGRYIVAIGSMHRGR